MAYTYILYSKLLDKYYIGHTSMLPSERLKKHLTDHDGFTAKAKDWLIVFEQEFETKSDALRRELAIKKKKSRKYIESLLSNET